MVIKRYNKAKESINSINFKEAGLSSNDINCLIYDTRGLTYAQIGDHDKAIDDYNEAIRINQYNWIDPGMRYNNRGAAYREMGNFSDAINDFNIAISRKKDHSIFYLNRGLTYQKMGKPQKAIEDYDRAVRLCPNYARNIIDRKFPFLYARNAVESAIELLTCIRDRDPKSAVSLYYRGVRAILVRGDKTAAKAAFELARDKGYSHAKVNEHLKNLSN